MKFAQTALVVAFVLQMSWVIAGEPAEPEKSILTVTLKAETVSSGEQIILSEIAELTPHDEKLEATPIVRAAIPGQNRNVASVDVLIAIRKAVGDRFDVRFKGLESKVTAVSQTITGLELVDAVGLALKKEIKKDPDLELQTDSANPPPDLLIRPGAYDVQCDLQEGGVRPGTQSVRVHVIQNGKRAADTTCLMACHVKCSVAVATEHLAAGEILEADGFKTIRREVTASELKERCNPEKLCGLRTKQSIAADQMLNKSQFAQPLVIKRGDAVRIVVHRGALELTAIGQARNDASMDEPVRLFVADSAAEVVARTSGLREASLDDPLARTK